MPAWKKTLYAAWIAQFLCILGFQFVQPFMPLIVQKLGQVDDHRASLLTGQIMGVAAFVMAFFAPIWGVMADRYGRKSMVIRAMFGGAVAVGLMATATNIWHLVAFRALQGMFAGVITACVALVSSVTPAKHSGYALGTMQGSVFLAHSVGPWIGAILYAAFDYRGAAAAGAVVMAIGGVLVKVLATEEFKRDPALSERTAFDAFMAPLRACFGTLRREGISRGATAFCAVGVRSASGVAGNTLREFLRMFRSPGFLITTFMFFQITFANSSFMPSFAFYMKKLVAAAEPGSISNGLLILLRKLSPASVVAVPAPDRELAQLVGAVASISGFVAASAAGAFGRLGDRWGHKTVLIFCTFLAGLCSIPAVFAQSLAQLVALRVAFGFAAAGIMPSANSILRNMTPPEHLGKAYGFMQSFRSVGMGAGMMIGGLISAHLGFGAPFMVTGVMFLVLPVFIGICIHGRRRAAE